MQVLERALNGVALLEPKVFGDDRGFFMESWNRRGFRELTGVDAEFVQDNHSRSARNVLRGLHYQILQPQGKLVRVAVGRVFDVALDVRRASPSFGQWYGTELSAENRRQLWIPEGYAHGFVALADDTRFLYKTTDVYARDCERAIAWNDATLAIAWPLPCGPLLAPKDAAAPAFTQADVFD